MRPNGFTQNGWERVASCKTGRIFKQFQALGAGKDTVWDCSDSPCRPGEPPFTEEQMDAYKASAGNM